MADQGSRGLAQLRDDLDEVVAQIRTLAQRGETDGAIGIRLNIRTSTVSALRRKHGIPAGKTRRETPGRQAPTVGMNLERARLLEAMRSPGNVRAAGVGVIRRMNGTNLRVDGPAKQLLELGWVTVGRDGVYRPTPAGDEALRVYRAERATGHGLVVSRCTPRAPQDDD